MALVEWTRPLFSVGPPPAPNRRLAANARRLDRLGAALVINNSRPERWWLSGEIVAEAARQLASDGYFVLDGFQGADAGVLLRKSAEQAHAAGELTAGRVSGAAGHGLAGVFRGDVSAAFGVTNSTRPPLPMRRFVQSTDALVYSLREHAARTTSPVAGCSEDAGLQHTTWRSSSLMIACYPGNQSRYVRHTDNSCDAGVGARCNGRRLTVIGYLNDRRSDPTDGAIRLFAAGPPTSEPLVDIEPLQDRLVTFWSDSRVPHEVLPSAFPRFAATLWYFDAIEAMRAEGALPLGASPWLHPVEAP